MFCTQEDQRLYLKAWEYNSARVLEYLAKIVEDNGGDVEPFRHCMANNRTYEPTAEPKRIMGQSWLNFVLDGMYYNINLDDNPFMEHWLIKTPVKDGKRLRQVYGQHLSREWMYDCLFEITTDEEVKEIAYELFNIVIQAKESERYCEKQRIQVANTYDEHWHWETKILPPEWVKIKWLDRTA